MRSLFRTICGCALLALMTAFPRAQEKSAAPEKAAGDRQENAAAPPVKEPAAKPGQAQKKSESEASRPEPAGPKTLLEDEAGAADNEEGEVKIFKLKNADAVAAQKQILEIYPGTKITADVRTNRLVARGAPDLLARIEAILLALDDAEALKRPGDEAPGGAGGRTGLGRESAGKRGQSTRDDWLRSLQMAADPEAEVRRVQTEFRRLDQNAAGLARQFRKAGEAAAAKGLSSLEDRACVKLKQELQSTLEAAFDARQKIQLYELEQLRQRLAQIESRLTLREQAEGEIVRQRVEELLHPERNWEPAAESDSAPADPNQRSADRAMSDSAKASAEAALPTEVAGNPRKEVFDAESAVAVAQASIQETKLFLANAEEKLSAFESAGSGAIPKTRLLDAKLEVNRQRAVLERNMSELKVKQRQLEQARETLATQIKLREYDLADARLRLDHATNDESRARTSYERGALSAGAYERKRLAMEEAKSQVQRAEAVLELYRNALPSSRIDDEPDSSKPSDDRPARRNPGGNRPSEEREAE